MKGAQYWRTLRSRTLRSRATNAERLLWERVRNRQVGGFKIVRQAAIGQFFTDFLCREKRIVIELDGETHDSDVREAADQERTNELSAMGYEVLRVTNEDVLSDVSKVVGRLLGGKTP